MNKLIFLATAVLVVGGVVWYLASGPGEEPSFVEEMSKDDGMAQVSMVNPKIFPDSGTFGRAVDFEWSIDDTEGTLSTHTAVHWGGPSDPREFGTDVGPNDAGYTEFTREFESGAFELPQDFTTKIDFPDPGLYHYRFHAIVGGLNFWSSEFSIEISQ